MKAVLGWIAVLLGSTGLGLVLYGQVVSSPEPAIALSTSSDALEIPKPRATVVVTKTRTVTDPGETVIVDVPTVAQQPTVASAPVASAAQPAAPTASTVVAEPVVSAPVAGDDHEDSAEPEDHERDD